MCYAELASPILTTTSCSDGFGEKGRPASGDEGAVPPGATLNIDLELVSWKTVTEVGDDKKILKKVLKEGEGYEHPNEGAVVRGISIMAEDILHFGYCRGLSNSF